MAMDKTTTRRMIGAIVLVLVAALVLAYLLKGKNNNQPITEKIHDVTLPTSPILAFPGNDGINGGIDSTQIPNANDKTGADKAGLNIVPNLQPKTVISGYAATTEKATQPEKKKVEIPTAKSINAKAAAEEKSKKNDLKKADVVKLDNKDKVSSSEHKASKKKEEKPQPKLVGEKNLPKYSDKPKKTEKEKKVVSKKAPATAKSENRDGIPTTGFSIQLLATGDEKKANGLQKTMLNEGYPSYVTPTIRNAKKLYRVRVGAYQEHDEADTVQARMKRRYVENSNIQNSYVVAN
jgi:cell division septation protein DedD